MRLSCLRLIVLFTLALPVAVKAEIYRWVDEHGEVHFGDRASAHGKGETEQVEVDEGSDATDAELEDYRQRSRRLLDVWEQERQLRREDAARQAKAEEEQQRACQRLREHLQQVRRSRYVYSDSADGGQNILDKDQRAAYEQRLQQTLIERCQ